MLGTVSSTRFRFGPFELDGGAGELRQHGIHMRLPKQPSQILTVHLTANRIVTREELRQQIRGSCLGLRGNGTQFQKETRLCAKLNH
jgi:DNA-binding response OmpR family regulator